MSENLEACPAFRSHRQGEMMRELTWAAIVAIVTVAEPSGFRTGFLTKDSLAFTESKIDGYQAVKDTQERYLAANGKQPGDPERASAIFMQLAESEQPPLHLYLGRDAYNRASGKLATMNEELEEWKPITISADYN